LRWRKFDRRLDIVVATNDLMVQVPGSRLLRLLQNCFSTFEIFGGEI
jgi:hypothetical protein